MSPCAGSWRATCSLTMPLPDDAPTAATDEPFGRRACRPSSAAEGGPLAELQAIDVADVRVTLTRPGGEAAWQGRIDTAARIGRGGSGGFEGSAELHFDQGGVPATATLSFADDPARGGTAGRLGFEGVRPAALAPLHPALAPAAALDLPLSGSIEAALDREGRIGPFAISATGGDGALVLSPALAERIGSPAAAQRLAVRELTLQASGAPAADTWAIDEFALGLADDAVLRLPQPLGLNLPLRRIDGAGRLAGTALTVERASVALEGGPKIEAHADIEDPFTSPHGQIEGTLREATIADVRRYWPKAYGKDAREWIDEHFPAGAIDDARMSATVAAENGVPTVSALALTIPVEGAVVDYQPPLPPVRNGSAVVSLDLNSLRVAVSRAPSAASPSPTAGWPFPISTRTCLRSTSRRKPVVRLPPPSTSWPRPFRIPRRHRDHRKPGRRLGRRPDPPRLPAAR